MTWQIILALPAIVVNAWQNAKDDLLTLSIIVCVAIFLHFYVRCMRLATELAREIREEARRDQLADTTSRRLAEDLEEKSEIHFRKKSHIKRISGDKKKGGDITII